MTLISSLCIDVIEAFKTLKSALFLFEAALQKDLTYPGWFEPPKELMLPSTWNTRKQAYSLIQQLEYLDSQKPREILVGAGIFAASEKTLQSITRLNQSKDQFKSCMLALKKANIKINDPFLNNAFEPLLEERRPTPIALSLKKMGLARLHLKQCYRRIPILLERPVKVSWTWANTKAITRITVLEAKSLLLKQGEDKSIEMQLAKLEKLSENEPLAIVQELAPHLRANIVFGVKESCRIMVKGPIPLFYLGNELDMLPNIRPPGMKRGKNKERRVRKDVKLEEEVFLPSIRVYKYKK